MMGSPFALRHSLFARDTTAELNLTQDTRGVKHCFFGDQDLSDVLRWRKANSERRASRMCWVEGAGLGDATVDLDSDDAAGLVKFQRCGRVKDSVTIQAG